MIIFVITGSIYSTILAFGIVFLLGHIFKIHKLIQDKLDKEKEQVLKDYNRLNEGTKLPSKMYIKIVYNIPLNKIKTKLLLEYVFWADILLIITSALGFGVSEFGINNETLILSVLGFWLLSIALFFILLVYTLQWYLFSE